MRFEALGYSIEKTKEEHIPHVIRLVKTEPHVLVPLNEVDMKERIAAGLSYIATSPTGEVVAHQGVRIWPESGRAELGSAVVLPPHRGLGLNRAMKEILIDILRQTMPHVTIMGLLERQSASLGIFTHLGFVPQPMSDVPIECFQVCPDEPGCYNKLGIDPPPCDCKHLVLHPGKEVSLGRLSMQT